MKGEKLEKYCEEEELMMKEEHGNRPKMWKKRPLRKLEQRKVGDGERKRAGKKVGTKGLE